MNRFKYQIILDLKLQYSFKLKKNLQNNSTLVLNAPFSFLRLEWVTDKSNLNTYNPLIISFLLVFYCLSSVTEFLS